MKKAFSLSIVLGFVWATQPFCIAKQPTDNPNAELKITIHLYNYAHVEAKTLAKTREQASQIFGHAGVEVIWLDEPLSFTVSSKSCNTTDSWDGTDFVLRLLPKLRDGISKKALGEAMSERIANIFLKRVEKYKAIEQLSTPQLLGHAIAHEIGHLLLGPNAHSQSGIMVATWMRPELRRMTKGDLLFTREQGQRMQEELRRRGNSAERLKEGSHVQSLNVETALRTTPPTLPTEQ